MLIVIFSSGRFWALPSLLQKLPSGFELSWVYHRNYLPGGLCIFIVCTHLTVSHATDVICFRILPVLHKVYFHVASIASHVAQSVNLIRVPQCLCSLGLHFVKVTLPLENSSSSTCECLDGLWNLRSYHRNFLIEENYVPKVSHSPCYVIRGRSLLMTCWRFVTVCMNVVFHDVGSVTRVAPETRLWRGGDPTQLGAS